MMRDLRLIAESLGIQLALQLAGALAPPCAVLDPAQARDPASLLRAPARQRAAPTAAAVEAPTLFFSRC